MDVHSALQTPPPGTLAPPAGTGATGQLVSAAAVNPPPATGPTAPNGPPGEETTLQRTIQKLFAPTVAAVDVSFRVTHDPNEIVTVFTNHDTGEEIAQFPPEIMVQIAEFFQKIAGAVMDRKA